MTRRPIASRDEELAQIKRCRALRGTGMTFSEIAAELDLHVSTVQRRMAAVGAGKRQKKVKSAAELKWIATRTAECLALRAEGLSISAISRRTGIGFNTVRQYLGLLPKTPKPRAPRAPVTPPVSRQCLGCGQLFPSEGIHNRRCLSCKGGRTCRKAG